MSSSDAESDCPSSDLADYEVTGDWRLDFEDQDAAGIAVPFDEGGATASQQSSGGPEQPAMEECSWAARLTAINLTQLQQLHTDVTTEYSKKAPQRGLHQQVMQRLQEAMGIPALALLSDATIARLKCLPPAAGACCWAA